MEDNSRLLGPVVKAWFARNEWPQSVSEGLARAKGWDCGPWASQISICMSGRLTPKPNFFRGLGQFNAAIAERDLVGVTDRRLMNRLKKGEPLCHDDGTPWTAQDFFACYLGHITAPEELRGPPARALTQEMVDEWVSQLRGAFRKLCLAMMLPPAAAWTELRVELVKLGIEGEELEYVQEIFAGVREASVEEAKRLLVKYDKPYVFMAMLTLQERYGGETTEIKKLLSWRDRLPETTNPKEAFPIDPRIAPMPEPPRRIGFDTEAQSDFHLVWPPNIRLRIT